MLLKGILTAEDAELAVASGAAGVIVSNHGGRQLDGVPAAIDALPEVAAAVRGRVPVLVDGGFRRGSDVLVALALGASAVMVGRPVLWALALRGEAGVAAALEMLARELRLSMRLAGCPSLREVTRDRVRHATELPLPGRAPEAGALARVGTMAAAPCVGGGSSDEEEGDRKGGRAPLAAGAPTTRPPPHHQPQQHTARRARL